MFLMAKKTMICLNKRKRENEISVDSFCETVGIDISFWLILASNVGKSFLAEGYVIGQPKVVGC